MSATSLRDQFDDVAARRRTLTVYADEPRPEIASHFEGWNVEVRFDRLPVGTADGFVTVRQGAEFLGSIDLRVFDPLLEPPAPPRSVGVVDDRPLDPVLGLLDDTTFRTFDRRQLLAVSREFEDRAWRVGTGRLHAGFQRPAAFDAQRDVYATLADSGLDVHVYVDGAWSGDPVEGVTTHADPDDELGRFWFVAFAADGDQDCALVAEERDDGYDGFWTYDRDRVAEIDDHLESTYW
jgi:hypothetical protein